MKDNDNTPADKDLADTALTDTVRRQLDLQAAELDDNTVNRLDTIRRQALQQARPRAEPTNTEQYGWYGRRSRWVYGSALAASVLLAALLLAINNDKPMLQPPSEQSGGFAIALMNEDFELLEEDIEFYLWLEEESAQG